MAVLYLGLSSSANAQSGGVTGTVTDSSGAVVPNATVEMRNPVSAFSRSTTTDSAGRFAFPNVPFNPYHVTTTAAGFTSSAQDVDVRSSVPTDIKIVLMVAGGASEVTVEASAGDLLETSSIAHTDVDRALFDKLPLESQSSSLSSLVTLASPGVAADSNGLFHGLGDHAENTFSLDGQPITDQQSKVFSNQIPIAAVQSMEVIPGAPPAEYGDKTSLIIVVATRSGQGVTTPHGDVTASYGSFGTSDLGADLSYGGEKWGNFISADGLDTGRFLDAPEFEVMHDKGNEENVFDRLDYQFSTADSVHLDLGFTRSWFQNPNSYDQLNIGVLGPNGVPVGQADQRSQIKTYNFAPTWTRLINPSTVFNFTPYLRKDEFNYYPSGNPLADLGPPGLQRESVAQARSLTNLGATSSLSYTKGVHNIKAGFTYQHTFLTENDSLGIVDPALNAPCLGINAAPVNGFTNPSQCAGAGYQPNIASNPNAPNTALYPLFNPVLSPYDLTRGGGYYTFYGHTDIKELGIYIQDTITLGNWTFNVGIRGDIYNGLSQGTQAEPRAGIAYRVKPTNTVLRISYARALETPFNENLIVSSTGCQYPVLAALVPCVPAVVTPGFRNEFHAGFQQAFGRFLVLDGEYIWKYTHNAYDFSDLGNTPIFFPIEWHNSKIDGFTFRASMPDFHGLTTLFTMSTVAARFFDPQIGGLGTTVGMAAGNSVFRIDHDELFNETTHLQYQPWKRGPWLGFNWRFDSGFVAGAIPCYATTVTCAASSTTLNGQPAVNMVDNNVGGVPLTADQEFQAGLFCGPVHATPNRAIPSPCLASQFGSTLINVPAPGTENDDHNPQRIMPRSLFDLSIGDDDLFHGEKYKWSLRLTAINLANSYVLYNFLSTFSGTHYVTPRTLTALIGFQF